MKKILSMLVCLVMVASFATSPLKASASTSTAGQNEQLIQLLMQMITILQAQLQVLIQQSTHTTPTVQETTPVVVIETASFKNSSLTSDSENPIIRGTATGFTTVGFSIDDGGKVYGSGQFSVIDGKWSHKVSTDLQPGTYGIRLYDSASNELDRETLTILDEEDVEDSDNKQNLTISDIELSLPNGIGHTSAVGDPVPDQKVTTEVKNNEYASFNGSGEKFNYSAALYEVSDSGSIIETPVKVTGEAPVPYANGYSSFEFYIEGGLSFNGDFERHYKVRVTVDTDDSVDESDEGDNAKWSNTWMVDYYKG